MGIREVLIILLLAVFACVFIAPALPRKYVPVKIKRRLAWLCVVLGALQIVDGSLNGHAGIAMFFIGLAEVVMYSRALLMFTDVKPRRTVGGWLIFFGLVLVVIGGTAR